MRRITETHVAVTVVNLLLRWRWTLAEKQIYQWLWPMDVGKRS